jgi:hypothetical protein
MSNSLNIVRKQFPHVTKVVDAKDGIIVNVSKRDSSEGKKKSPENCALAKACIREQKADGAIINVGTSYIIKGNIATRYNTSIAVGREITSFDRHQDFAEGRYVLSKISPSKKIGRQRVSGDSTQTGTQLKHKIYQHRTEDIRISTK